MFENQKMRDGDPAFGIEATFQIHDTIYVLTDEADERLLALLSNRDYMFEPYSVTPGNDRGYIARKVYHVSPDEILDDLLFFPGEATTDPTSFTVSQKYMNAPKHSLGEKDIHDSIIRLSGKPSKPEWHYRHTDCFDGVALSRMNGFVENMVDVESSVWNDFLTATRSFHAKDFIRYMVYWAAKNSDGLPRQISHNSPIRGPFETIDPKMPFQCKQPLTGFPYRHYKI